ncbi:MAG: hypothetical protein GXO78_02770 [Calditrichaeota bacterium]|nr:hypothetical protein [Calditrichota bacterium]
MPDVLLIPSDHGGGMGHVSRCIYLGRRLAEQGHRVGIVLEPKHYAAGIEAGLTTFLLDTRRERWRKYQLKRPFRPTLKLKTRIWKAPIFVEFSSLAYQVPRDGYLSEKIVRHRWEILSGIVESFRPQVLVGDTHFLTRLLGARYQLPVVQITRFAGYPPDPRLIWWKAVPRDLIEPDALAPFRELLQQVGLTDVQRAEDLLRGDRYLIPSIPEIEPIASPDASTLFCGPFARDVEAPTAADVPFPSDGPRVYVSIGGGAGRSGEKRFFQVVQEAFAGTPFRVLVSTGKRIAARKFQGAVHNILFRDWVNGPAAIRWSDLVIFHGGYATMMETLLAARPALVIPSHTEQEGNGRRLEALTVGQVVCLHRNRFQPLVFQWPYGQYQMLASFDFALTPDDLRQACEQMIQSAPSETLQLFQQKLKKYQQAFDIEKALSF